MPGLQEMLVIAVVALLVFGPDRLPEVARNAGKFIGKLRAETNRNMSELKDLSEIRELQRELNSLRSEINGVTSGFRDPLRGSTSASGGQTRRMVPADQHGGRPRADDGSAAATRAVDDTPPPTDPDAT